MNLYSIEAEQQILGGILIDHTAYDRASEVVTDADFYTDGHGDIFRSMGELKAKGVPIEPVNLMEHMQEKGLEYDMPYIVELAANTPSASNIGSYCRIVRDRAQKRFLRDTLDSAGQLIYKDMESDSEQLISKVAAMVGLLQCSDGQGIRNTKEIMKSLTQKWKYRSEMGDTIDGLETGIPSIDERHMGWKPGELIFIGGRPSMGKSILAFQIAQFNCIKREKNGLAFSVEMPGEQVLQRMTANLGSVPLGVFDKCAKEDFGQHSQSISFAATLLSKSKLKIDDTAGIHINQIMARARSAHRREKLDFVLIDHIHIIKSDGQSREREIANITWSLKTLAKELGCPVIAVGQLNRGVEQRTNKRPMMSDLRDSGSVEQDADRILLLYRDEYYNPDSMDKGVVEIITAKFREGVLGTDHCAAVLHMSKIEDLAFEYQPREQAPVKRRGFE